jgi:hypothetical protein
LTPTSIWEVAEAFPVQPATVIDSTVERSGIVTSVPLGAGEQPPRRRVGVGVDRFNGANAIRAG